jgi:hypothetical protein
MAQRRMFSKEVTESDMFLDMPSDAQLLYFHLGIQADDDGFVSPHRVMRMVGITNKDALGLLAAKKFVIPFQDGVVVITHWRVNNYLRNDRYKETIYKGDMALLSCDENMVYQLDTTGIPLVDAGKVRIGKVSKEKATDTTTGFSLFWKSYPRKTAKGDAERAWRKLNPSEELQQTILAAVERAKQSEQWQRDGGRFIPYPTTWLNGRRWEDEVATVTSVGVDKI